MSVARARRDVKAERKRVRRWERLITLAAKRWIFDGSTSWAGRIDREVQRRASIRHRMALTRLEEAEQRLFTELRKRRGDTFPDLV